MILSLIEKETTETESLALFIRKDAPVVCVPATSGTNRLAFGLSATKAVLNISDIIPYFYHQNSSSISHWINNKPRNLQNLLNYFNRTEISVSSLLISSIILPIIFVLHSKDSLLLLCRYLFYNYLPHYSH